MWADRGRLVLLLYSRLRPRAALALALAVAFPGRFVASELVQQATTEASMRVCFRFDVWVAAGRGWSVRGEGYNIVCIPYDRTYVVPPAGQAGRGDFQGLNFFFFQKWRILLFVRQTKSGMWVGQAHRTSSLSSVLGLRFSGDG